MFEDEGQQQFFMLNEGTEDFYNFKDWRLEDEEEETVEEDVDLKKIVIVDSSPFFRNILKNHLETAGYKVLGNFSAAQETCEFLSQEPVRFVAVDIDQTDGGNAKSVHLIADAQPHTVFILSSSRFSKEQAASIGERPYYFLLKPVTRETLEKVMKKAYDTELARKVKPKESPPNPTQ